MKGWKDLEIVKKQLQNNVDIIIFIETRKFLKLQFHLFQECALPCFWLNIHIGIKLS